jgi:hypothetical protein
MDELEKLRDENAKLRSELSIAYSNNAERNRLLDALGMVWCSGGCKHGMARYDGRAITAEAVAALITNAARARAWFVSKAGRDFWRGRTVSMDDIRVVWAKAGAEVDARIPLAYRKATP